MNFNDQDSSTNIENKVSEGLDFVLNHFNEPIWPRTVATKFTNGAQIAVQNKEEALKLYRDSNYVDCRINAYPYESCNNNGKLQLINFALVDLDMSTFGYSKQVLDKELNKILKNLNKVFGFTPSVVWSGNGYHIYVQIEPLKCILEEMQEFSRFKESSKELLRFIERYLSNNKCDSVHNSTMSFSNCMLRIPNSFNSKCMNEKENNLLSSQVNIKQRWDGKSRLPLKLLLGDFLASLVDRDQELVKKCAKTHDGILSKNGSSLPIDWIELLLQTPISDYRKFCIWRIFSPYLIIKRRLDYDKSYSIIESWLDKCNEVETLDFDYDYKINEGLNGALNKGCYPVALRDLKEECPELYSIVWNRVRCKTTR